LYGWMTTAFMRRMHPVLAVLATSGIGLVLALTLGVVAQACINENRAMGSGSAQPPPLQGRPAPALHGDVMTAADALLKRERPDEARPLLEDYLRERPED